MKPARLSPATSDLVTRVCAALTADDVPFVLVLDGSRDTYSVGSHRPDGCEDWSFAAWVIDRVLEGQEAAGHTQREEDTDPSARPVAVRNGDR